MTPQGVIILGGGIAGIAAALDLRAAGHPVTLVEARSFLGGRAFSFTDAATGQAIDNGQHIIIGRCHSFRQLLARLGVSDKWYLQPRLDVPILDRSGKTARLRSGPLPLPFNLLPSLLSYPHLSRRERRQALTAMTAARRCNRADPELETITFHHWLRQHNQSERAIRNLWNLISEPALNDNARQVSAAMGLMLIQEGLLQERHGPNIGYPKTDLTAALGEPARRCLAQAGVQLLLGNPARRILIENSAVTGVTLADGQTLTAHAVISALPFDLLLNLLPPSTRQSPYFRRLTRLEWSPIVNLHLWYNKPVMNHAFCAFIDRPLQWVFNKTRSAGQPGPGQRLAISLSAAWSYIDREPEQLVQDFAAELAAAFPAARNARLDHARVVKQRRATFRCLPGAAALRPGPATPLSNFFLAGEWTDTGWPSTMEGAARSGQRAAQAAIPILSGVFS